MGIRKESLEVGQVYHIFTKSIAEFKIFNNHNEFSRMVETIHYYQAEKPALKLSRFLELDKSRDTPLAKNLNKEILVEIISYCLMPTHIHIILKQIKENGISIFMQHILNSYAKYFNIKHNRKGPLWESRFKNILVATDEQLLHLTRYIHLNPVTAYLVNKPEDWIASSYCEYISPCKGLCKYDYILDIKPDSYREFVEDRISYQRELAKIKSVSLE